MAKGDFKKNIEGAKETMDELLFATRDFTDEVKKSAKEVFGIGTSANSATKAFRDISTSLQNMSSQMDDIVEGNVTVKDLAKEQNKYAKTQAKFQTEYSQALSKAGVSQKEINKVLNGNLTLSELRVKYADLATSSEGDLLEIYEEQAKINADNALIMADMAKRANNIQKGVGLAGAAFSGLGGILKKAGLKDIGDKMGLDEAVAEGRKLSATLTKGGKNAAGLGTKLKVAGKMAATIGKNLMASFGPIALIGIAIKELIGGFTTIDTLNGKMAKDLGISYQQANALNGVYMKQSDEFKELNIQHHQIVEAQGKLNEKFQTGGLFSSKIANDYAHIQERTNLSDKAMGFLVKKQIKGEKTIKNQLKSLQKTVTQFNIQNKMTLNVNKVMEKIATASKSIHLFTKGNVAELAKTTMLAQKFGAEMSTIEGISSSLLDFESSIQNELEAELLLGQDINLEKARQYALTGDTAKLTEELMNQEAILNAFATDNVIAQEAAAKAMGLTRTQLAEIVMSQQEQEALQKTFGEGVNDVNGAYDAYKEKLAEGKTEQEIFNELGNENLQRQLESLSLEESLKKEKEEAKDIAKEQAITMLSMVTSIDSLIKNAKTFAKILMGIYGTYLLIKGIQAVSLALQVARGTAEKASLVTQFGSVGALVAQAAAWAIMNPIPAIAGLAAAAAVGGVVYSQMSDGVIGPGGETVVSGPKGTIQLDKQDSMIVGTNLGGKGGNRQENRQDNSEMLGLLKQIANKNTVIEMGGNEVGQGINTAEREIQ